MPDIAGLKPDASTSRKMLLKLLEAVLRIVCVTARLQSCSDESATVWALAPATTASGAEALEIVSRFAGRLK
jgi:hypothetical protein